ncbi:MAG: ATP-dependent DNA ligase, partial [Acidobacteriota bacterium]|nr:ATP-dependent DNA ligase [Acidobacteriota bacterium]
MQLAAVVETSRLVAETSKRLRKTGLLADLLQQASPDEIEVVVAFLSSRSRQGRIGIGYGALRDSASLAAPQPSLGLLEVDRILQLIAGTKGSGSERGRVEILKNLMIRATHAEQEFLQGLLLGEIRQGALEGLMVDALAKAFDVPLPRVRRAVMLQGDITPIARILREKGEAGLSRHDVQLFRPVQPMLAQSCEDVGEAMGELEQVALEYKLDGARVQAHRSGDDVVVFSRSLNDVTAAVPEIVEAVRALPERDLILDGEVLAMGTVAAGSRPLPFQTTMRRFGRKLDVDRMRGELPLSPFWFDLLYVNGSSLLNEPQSRRFAALEQVAPAEFIVPHTVALNPGQASDFFEAALQQGHEGIMAKALNASYAAGARGQSWL